MAYDEELALRFRQSLGEQPGITKRKMFGGLCFMIKTISQMQFTPVISSEARNLNSETGLQAAIYRFLTVFGMTTLGFVKSSLMIVFR